MQALFTPAVAAMNRLSYSKKFLVLGCLSMLAVLVVIYNLYQSLNRVIVSSQLELQGLVQIEAVTRAIQATQKHRGLSSAVRGGIKTLGDELIALETETGQALNAVERVLPLDPSVGNAFKSIKTRWAEIQQNASNADIETSYRIHTDLIDQLLEFEKILGDAALLSTDSELDSYHLLMLTTSELPIVLENIGQFRAFGVGVLARQAITPEQKLKMLVLKANIEQSINNVAGNLEHTRRFNPALKSVLDTTQKNMESASRLITGHVITDIVEEHFAVDPEYFFSAVSLALDTAYLQIYDYFLPTTKKLIEDRIANARQTLRLSMGIPGGLFILIGYFAIGAHLSVTRNISALAKAAKGFVDGDLRQRLSVTSQDEIGQVANSFNEMANGFNTLLEKRELDDRRLQSIIDTALDAVVQMDADGVLRGWNRQAEQIFGWRADEVAGCLLHETIVPERFRKAHWRGVQHFLETGEGSVLNKRIEVVALHRDGHEFPIELAITPNRLPDTVEFSAFIRDISQQKHALHTLQTNEQRYRALFESSRDAIITLSPTRGIVSANPAAIKLFGCRDEQEVISHTPVTLSPEFQPNGSLSSDMASEMINNAQEKGSSVFEWVHRRVDDSESFFAEVQLSRVEIDQEVLLQATVRDVTAQKRDRAAIVTNEARTRAVLRTMSDAVVLIDPKGNMLLVNDAIGEMFGYEEDELIGQNVKMLMPEPYHSEHDGYLRRHAETKDRVIIGRRTEVKGKRRDGRILPIELCVNELMDDNGSTFIGVMRDISHRKAVEQAHESARLEAERLAHAKSEFLANMSHEIRTPLNAVIGLAKMTVRENRGRPSQQHCERILDAGTHLLNLVNDILDFSKIEAGKMTLDIHPFQLGKLIDDAMSLIELRAREKQLNLEVEREADLPDWVSGDPLRLRQIIVNLLSNAVKFTEKGYVRVTVTRKQEQIRISVTDSGIGLSQEQVTRLFTAFEQADTSTTRKFGGSGLGLAISRNLASMMGGDILVNSALGVGSQFTLLVTLPPCEAGVDQQLLGSEYDGPRLQGLRVLAAEDVALNRLVLDDLLIQEGAQVTFAENGRQALDILRDIGPEEFDVILMDIQMPVMDGYQAAREIAKLAPRLPIIGLTAHAMPEERIRCMDAGMRERITKPIDVNALVAAIRQNVPDLLALADQSQALMDDDVKQAESAIIEQQGGVIDWPSFLQRYEGRQAFIDKLVLNALDGVQRQNIIKLRQAADETDGDIIKFVAHSLKGLAGVFQAQSLLELAQQTEVAAKNQQQDQVVLARQLADTLQTLLTELENYHSAQKNQ